MDVVHRDRGGLELPAGQKAGAAGWRDPSLEAGVLASPGRRPFLPGLLSPPPYPTSRSPAMVRTGRKSFHSTKTKNKNLVSGKVKIVHLFVLHNDARFAVVHTGQRHLPSVLCEQIFSTLVAAANMRCVYLLTNTKEILSLAANQ